MADTATRTELHVGTYVEHEKYADLTWQCAPDCLHPDH